MHCTRLPCWLQYYSLAATDTAVYGWGSNAYLSTGTNHDKAADVLHPTAVSGPLSSGAWTIHSLAAGFQHAFAVASTADTVTASLRASSGSQAAAPEQQQQGGAAGIEVVLTEAQQAARQRAQQAADAAASSPAVENGEVQPQQPQHEAANDSGPVSADRSSEAGSEGGRSSKSSSSSSDSASSFHTRYLAQQPPPLQAPVQAVWMAWKPSPYHEQLVALSRDVFDLLPVSYNSVHKNPCWGGEGPGLTCLPFFNIIGVSKCGTTDLYQRLMLYKDRLLPATNKVRACVFALLCACVCTMALCSAVERVSAQPTTNVLPACAGPALLGRVPLPSCSRRRRRLPSWRQRRLQGLHQPVQPSVRPHSQPPGCRHR
jgi:hypothetical protein